MEISDFYAPELDVYARLTEAQLLNKDRPEEGLFIAESPKELLTRDMSRYHFLWKRAVWKKRQNGFPTGA